MRITAASNLTCNHITMIQQVWIRHKISQLCLFLSYLHCQLSHKGKRKPQNNPNTNTGLSQISKELLKWRFYKLNSTSANLYISLRNPAVTFFSLATNPNKLIGCEWDPQTKHRSLECAGCRGTKGGGGEVSPLCCIKPIEKLVSQEDQIPANPQHWETVRKHKSAPLQAES